MERFRHITVQPLAGALGAVIGGVDLNDELDEHTFAEIYKALDRHLVIFFHDQQLTPRAQIAFGRRFGELKAHPYLAGLDEYPEIMVISKEPDQQHNFAGAWHTDTSYHEIPTMASMLYALEVPKDKGDTLFANMYLACETLSEPLRNMLSGMRAVHSYFGVHGSGRERDLGYGGGGSNADNRSVVHPVIRTHPRTGRNALYVNAMFTERIEDLSQTESDALLEFLYVHSTRAEFICRFRWRKGSIALWDNRCTLHYPLNDYPGERRVMHRITIAGERPVYEPAG